jgi:hypothetical protein
MQGKLFFVQKLFLEKNLFVLKKVLLLKFCMHFKAFGVIFGAFGVDKTTLVKFWGREIGAVCRFLNNSVENTVMSVLKCSAMRTF